MTAAAISRGSDWQEALEAVIQDAGATTSADLALFFASAAYADHFEAMVRRVQSATGAAVVAGCSGQGIIGPEREIEDEPALSLMALPLPGATVRACYITQANLVEAIEPAYWQHHTQMAPQDVNAWLLFADPFRLDTEAFLTSFSAAYPGTPIVGGLASGAMQRQLTHVFLN
ncbi:MAG: FIST N-terminal domain-containing protein, partial [Chloroflexota bacterium]